MCENDVFVLPVNILTGVARQLLGPHDTLPCVLIYCMVSSCLLLYHCTVLMVQFSQNVFTGSESSGIVPVTLLLRGGTSDIDISVTVIPSDQSPLSAEGKRCVP